jgi:CubicO group peptidase (beta-lactamase class C family)
VTAEELCYSETLGHADIESSRALEPRQRHRIGSITKTMVGLCTMALVEEAKLALEDRVIDRLPEIRFEGPADALLIRHLLTHTGGIGEAPTLEHLRDPESALWSDTAEIPAVADSYPDGILLEVPPGTKWAYANHGWALLGEIVARADGCPIHEVLRRRVRTSRW